MFYAHVNSCTRSFILYTIIIYISFIFDVYGHLELYKTIKFFSLNGSKICQKSCRKQFILIVYKYLQQSFLRRPSDCSTRPSFHPCIFTLRCTIMVLFSFSYDITSKAENFFWVTDCRHNPINQSIEFKTQSQTVKNQNRVPRFTASKIRITVSFWKVKLMINTPFVLSLKNIRSQILKIDV